MSARAFRTPLVCAVMMLFVTLGAGPAGADVAAGDTAASAVGAIAQPAASGVGPADTSSARDYVREVREAFTDENREYSGIRTVLRFVGPPYGVLIALFLLFSGLSARMRDAAHRRAAGRYARMLVYVALYATAATVLALPLTWYEEFALEHRFGLSNQPFGAWCVDQVKGLVVTVVVFGATGLVALAYRAIERSPRRWWLWLSAGTLPVILVSVVLAPLVVDPLYNRFEPLRDPVLRREILDLGARAGIPARNVYQVDKSRQTKKFNAYVTGFGASQRIVLWDTTLEGMARDEILFVMGHEMGHYALAHVWKGVALYTLLGFGLFLFSAWVMRRAVARFGGRWGFRDLHDAASLPLLVATLTVAGFVAEPITNAFSRSIEREADVFALEVTRLNDAGARAFLKLGAQNKSNPEPSPAVKLFQYTHPPLVERVRFALEYRPWERGEPNRAWRGTFVEPEAGR